MEKLNAWKKYLCCWSGMAESAERRWLSVKNHTGVRRPVA